MKMVSWRTGIVGLKEVVEVVNNVTARWGFRFADLARVCANFAQCENGWSQA